MELWVEPRLRGFVVIRDPRNPPSRVGEVLPYAAGWRSPARRWFAAPASLGANRYSATVLRVATARAEWLAMGAMPRDLRRRLREGLIDHTLEQPAKIPVAVPLALAAVAAGAAVAAITTSADWLLATIMLGWLAAALWTDSRRDVRTMRIDHGHVVIERNDGATLGYPLAAIRTLRRFQGAREISFEDGTSFRFGSGLRDRWILRLLQREFAPDSIVTDARAANRYAARVFFLYLPLLCPVLVSLATTGGLSALFHLRGGLLGSIAYVTATFYAASFTYWSVCYLGIRVAFWSRVRRARSKAKRGASAGPKWSVFPLVPLEREAR